VTSTPRRIFHLVAREDWALAQAAGTYAPPSLGTEGFIHFSARDQVLRSAARFYAGRDDMLVLVVDEARVGPAVRYEAAHGELFPHVYGALNLDAVEEALPLSRDGDTFVLPDRLAPAC
jgi:uncharacterized protein (DUF952 family)